jgi:hypothetical protein
MATRRPHHKHRVVCLPARRQELVSVQQWERWELSVSSTPFSYSGGDQKPHNTALLHRWKWMLRSGDQSMRLGYNSSIKRQNCRLFGDICCKRSLGASFSLLTTMIPYSCPVMSCISMPVISQMVVEEVLIETSMIFRQCPMTHFLRQLLCLLTSASCPKNDNAEVSC